MNIPLSNELYWLILTILMTALFWVPYILNRMLEQGILNALWDPFGDTATQNKWASRMMQAHKNAIENLVIFIPLVLIIQLTESNSSVSDSACMVYFFARLVHFIAFTFAIPVLRVLMFIIGFVAQITLILILLGIS